MRTTLDIHDDLLIRAKKRAADTRQTLTAVVEEALRLALQPNQRKGHKPFKLRTFKGDGVRPGIDISNTAALTAFLESEKDASYRH